MKNLFFLFIILGTAVVSWAQTPNKMSYQAVVRDANNQLITNQEVGIRISILQDSETGDVLYSEIQNGFTNENGLFSIQVGTGTVLQGYHFGEIIWSNGSKFMKTEIDPSGGEAYSITGVSEILSVPYAKHAETVEYMDIRVSTTGDTIFFGDFNFFIIPGISAANPAYVSSDITDNDGNSYYSVNIGMQEWLTSNLKTTRLNDDAIIPFLPENSAWSTTAEPAFSLYNNDINNILKYGALYNWAAVETGKLCPVGWHVPTSEDWTTLTIFLGGEDVAGAKLKESGNVHWTEGNISTTNETEFTALPGGYRSGTGPYYYDGYWGYWWTATEYNATSAYYKLMSTYYDYVSGSVDNKTSGYSVRCVRN